MLNGVVVDADLDEDHAKKIWASRKHHNMIMVEFYSYQLQHRNTNGITLLQGDWLRHQYIVDAYVAIEQNRLRYLCLNKKNLCVGLYHGLQDAIGASDNNATTIGQRIILPSSFTVGPRHMV
jgi:hypothetical protein